jgi:hypothetical protein
VLFLLEGVVVAFVLPRVLVEPDDTSALTQLERYYGPSMEQGASYTGSLFDGWDSAGTRDADRNVFTADDLVAVSLLSVEVSPRAAYALLHTQRDRLSELLTAVGDDRDLADEREEISADWPAWRLHDELRGLPGIGRTTASKLLARKRPRLLPIWDSVVAAVTGTAHDQWEPLRLALRADDKALHNRLLGLRAKAGLDTDVSSLRVLDVLAWLEGKSHGL